MLEKQEKAKETILMRTKIYIFEQSILNCEVVWTRIYPKESYIWVGVRNVGCCREVGVLELTVSDWDTGVRKKKKRTLTCGPANRLSLAEQDFTGENFGRRKIISNSHRKTLWPVFLQVFSVKMS
jgi:hypothetical protein